MLKISLKEFLILRMQKFQGKGDFQICISVPLVG